MFNVLGVNALPKPSEIEHDETEISPKVFKSNYEQSGFTLSFKQGTEISQILSAEFVNILSYSQEPISFEILSNSETINIQIICSIQDKERIKTHIIGYFPTIQIKDVKPFNIGFNMEQTVGIADFGLSEEFTFLSKGSLALKIELAGGVKSSKFLPPP